MKLFAIIWLGITISVIITSEAKAQKKGNETVTEIQTATPVYFVIWEGEEGDGAVEVQLHDRKHQIQSMEYDRVTDQAKGLDPKNPLLKWINIPEIDPRAFRLVETLEEAKLPADGTSVIEMRHNKVKQAHRIIYILPN